MALILGPGGAKAFAHVGVLRAFQQQRVPITKIVGLEWGALVGALFAHRGQAHDLEWKLYKMEQQNLPRPKGLFVRRDVTVKAMDGFLSDAFGRDEVAGAKVPFACPSRSLWSGVVTWQTRGSFRDVVKRCLAYPPTFTVEGSFLAGASQATEAVEVLKREGYDVIVLVNVLGSGLPTAQDGLLENARDVILWQEVKRALSETARFDVELVNVDTSAYPVLQFDARKDLVQLGEGVGVKAAAKLIQKHGL